VVAAPALISVFGMGWLWSPVPEDADKFALAVDMLRLTFPYLFFVSMTAMAGGILNTYQRFAVPAFAPVLLNVVLILFATLVAPYYSRPGLALAAGVFAAGVVQLVFMLPFLLRLKVLPVPRWDIAHRGVRKIMRLMAPAIFGSSVAQINILFDTLIASFLVTGSISWLYYSDRLMEFPLGVFGIALATVILPNLSRHHASESPQEFSATLDWAMRLTMLIALPATIGLFLLAGPLLTDRFHLRKGAGTRVLCSPGYANAGAYRYCRAGRQYATERFDRRAVGPGRVGSSAHRPGDRNLGLGFSECRPFVSRIASAGRLAATTGLATLSAAGGCRLRRDGHVAA
jgi:putative peptidoglycan lipid II flippase